MDQDKANLLIDKLGILLLIDVPEHIQFGIDNTFWNTGSKFKGVKLIPQGPHYISYSFKDENHSFKLGFFMNINEKKRIHIKKFNPEIGDFLNIDQDEFERYESGLKNYEFDCFLGAYPMENNENWNECSNYIVQQVIDKIDPIEKKTINIEQEYNNTVQLSDQQKLYQQYDDYKDIYDGNQNQDQQQKKQKQENQENFQTIYGTIYYSEVPQRKYIMGVSGQQLTELNLDKSNIFQDFLKKEYQNQHKLYFGEMQYSFIVFLLREDLQSFEQWKKMLILILSCDKLIKEQSQIFIDFIPVIYSQLKQFPEDFFIDSISSNNFMRKTLKNFIETIQNDSDVILLKKRCKRLNEFLQKKFQFFIDIDYPEDDEMPIIVDQSEFVNLD